MNPRRGPGVGWLIALLSLCAGRVDAGERPSLLVVPAAGEQETRLLGNTEAELARSARYRVLLLPALLPLMREADDRENVRRRASALVEEGRQLLMGLEHEKAKARLEAALEMLERSFVRFYDPRSMAQVRLLLGVWALERARPDLARREFEEAHQLDPSLTLDAHYSPQVRAAFNEARQGAAVRAAPGAAQLQKLLRLAGSRAAVVLGIEPAGERALLRGAVFAAGTASYSGVESLLVEVTSPESVSRGSAALGAQLRRLVEPLYPAPPPPEIRNIVTPPPPPPPPTTPWYRRWYTWAVAGVLVAGTVAVVLPLTLKREVVETTLRW